MGRNGASPARQSGSGAQAALTCADWLIPRPPNAPAEAEGAFVNALAFELWC